MEVIKTDIFVNRRSSKVMFFGVVFSLVLSLILGVESVFAHTTTLSTSGTVRVNVSTAADSAAMGTDNVVVNSTCPLGYTLSIGGPSDNTLYKGGNSNNTAINTTTGTVSTPKALVGEGNLGTWGYSVASGTTATSSNFIGLTNATAVLTTKGSASAVGGDMVPVYYGVSIDNSIEPGLYKMSNNSAVTYYLTAEVNCSIYKIQYNDNGANSATTMSITHNNVAENDEITLYASNYQRSGYGFAGWSTTQLNPDAATFQTDLATAISNGEVYGPNETITANANFLNKAVISNNEQVINLYAIWVKPETNANLQNWTGCSTMSNGDIVALKDTRDNQVYAVAKLADGNCWMIENLRLDTAGSSDASKAQEYGGSFSSLANPETADFSNSTTANSLYYSGTQSGTATVNIGTGSNPGYRMPRYSNVNSAVSDMTTADQGVYSYGNYYNWAAAKANTSALTNVSSSNAAKTSLCPSGWKLPVGTQTAENGGFGALSVALGGPAGGAIADDNSTPTGTILSKNFRKYPNNFVYAGYYTGSGSTTMGSNAHYWSATASTTTAYRFTLSTDSVNPATSAAYKYGGRPIRCIASLGYTITYDANGGTGSVASQTLTNSDSATLELASNGFARDGYYFKGWATSANGAVAFRANETVTTQQIHNDTTLYAVWGVSADTALYDAVESLTKGTLASKSLTLKTEITKGNSGVYTYDASTSGTASDASTSNPIYFYRGILDNTLGTYGSDGDAANYSNYVKLSNNTCWRIFRTTGSGGVKMIYNGTWDTTNNTCARTGQDTWAGNVKYGRAGSSGQSADWQYNIHKAGYTYNKAMNDIEATTAVNTVFGSSSNPLLNNTRSNIKIFLEDTWYAGNMTNYTGLLEASAGYCNDRTLFASSTSVTEIVPYATSGTNSFGAYRRNQVTSGNGSSLECSRGAVDVYRYVKNSDTGWTSNELKYPTALITMDEAALSGSGSSTASHVTTYNSNSFLNPGAMFWTMSPRSRATYATYMEVIGNNGASNASAIHAGGISGSQRGARPVISLQSGVKIGGGSGTATNPWTISSYGVSFEANGGGGTMTDQVIQRGVATALSSSTFTAPTNRTFKGWNTAADGSGTSYANGASVTNIANSGESITLYAQWGCPAGQVCYNDNGANSATTMGNESVGSSDTEVILWASNFKRSGYGFAGWNTAADGSGTDYGPNETITNTTTLNTIKNGGLRLYAKWVASAGNIQGWIGCPAMSQGDVTALKDTRDNQVYAVAKLADGNCWMIENLRLNASNSSDSSKAQGFGGVFAGLADSETSNLSNTTTANSLYYSGTQDGTASINIGTGSTPAARIPRYNSSNTTATVGSMSDADQNVYSYGNYYNWAATKANTASLANATNSNNAKTSLCPAGWMLPLGTQTTSDKSFGALSAALGGPADGSTADDTTNPTGTVVSNNFRKYPNNFVYAGYMSGSSITSRGSNTNHWTGTSSAAGSAYRLTLLAASVNPATNTTTKYGGRPMRCIMMTDRTISYDANGGTGSVSAQTLTVGGTLELASNGFSRDGYYFKGWATSASGAVAFRPNEIVDASQIHNDTTLYAVWGTSAGTTLFNAVSSLTKGTLASKSVSLSDPINKSNSGVYTYDSGTYGTASDSSTSNSIYFYRGVLDNNIGTYGSDGDAANYPNYIKLDNNTCWRIIRTTGSGGVKMIYNGVWDSTNNTCANATTNAQVTTKAFGRKGGSTASSTNWRYNVSRVGYTYNSAVDDSTTSTSVNTVFGNSSDLTLNDSNSNMKNYLENTWYPNNMGSYTSLLEANAGYCNDRSAFSNASATPTALSNVVPYATTSALVYFGPRERNIVAGGSPSLNCSRGDVDVYRYVSSSSTGYTANELRFPTALATMDEISFAITGKSAVSNANSFLNTGSAFLTLSPNRRTDAGITYMQIVSSAGNFADSGVNTTTNGVRPVVSIKSDTQIGGGSGTASNPWTLDLAGYIYYDANGADGNTTMDRQSVDSSATSATLWASNFKRSGYGFAGWNTAADGSGTNYGPNEDITDTATLSTIQSSGLRLYAKWVASAGNLQGWTGCSSLAQGAVTALTDTRDNDTYAVAKLADGNCWMIENLRLDYDASHNTDGTLSQGYGGQFAGLAQPETANFTATNNSATDPTEPNSLYYAGTGNQGNLGATIDILQQNYAGYRMPRYRNDNTNSDISINPNTTVNSMASMGQSIYSYGNYYTWAAAIANTGYYSTNNQSATTSLCPTGWRLPKGGNKTRIVSNDDNDFWNLIVDGLNNGTNPANYSGVTTPYYDGSSEGTPVSKLVRAYPNNFLYSGETDSSSVNYRGSSGFYWSSTTNTNTSSYALYLYTSRVRPGTYLTGKYNGYSIRCLVGS